MAQRKPLVIIDGRLSELPSGDVLSGSEDGMYSKRVDFVGETIIYKGEALAGASEMSAVWRLRKLILSVDGDVQELFADGDAEFDNIWNDRAAKAYA
jgi:hypothetical protein